MKTLRLLVLLLTLGTVATVHAADTASSAPLFNAIMTMGKEHRFVLLSSAGKPSAWLRVGSTFEGYTLKAYDEKSGGLDLERDGKVTRVTIMADAATQSSGSASPLTTTPATLADAENMLKVMHFEEMLSAIVAQQKKAMGPMLQQSMARMNVPAEDRERVMAIQKKAVDEAMDAMMGPDMTADIARIYSNVFSKEEISAMSSFYATPAGQAMVSKQPQVQEQMMQAMMPRMMQIGPKLQAAMQDYAKERAAAGAATATAPAAPATAPKP